MSSDLWWANQLPGETHQNTRPWFCAGKKYYNDPWCFNRTKLSQWPNLRELVIIGNVPLVDTLKSLAKNFEIEKTHKNRCTKTGKWIIKNDSLFNMILKGNTTFRKKQQNMPELAHMSNEHLLGYTLPRSSVTISNSHDITLVFVF